MPMPSTAKGKDSANAFTNAGVDVQDFQIIVAV